MLRGRSVQTTVYPLRVGHSVGLPYPPILDLQNSVYIRSGGSTYYTTQSTLVNAGANVKRFDSRSNGRLALCEGQHTNLCLQSCAFDTGSWTKTNTTVTANTSSFVDPLSTNIADILSVTSSGSAATTTQAVTVSAGNHVFSLWVRSATTSQSCYISITDGSTTTTQSFTPTSSWSRQRVFMNITTTTATVEIGLHASGGTGTAGDDLAVFGAQLETGLNTTSNVITTAASATANIDSWTYASGNYSSDLGTKRWAVNIRPTNANTQGPAAARSIYSFGGINDELLITSADVLRVQAGGAAIVSSSGFTWGPDQNIWVYLDPAVGTMRIEGATGGNGLYTGTPWTWPTNVTLRIGGRVAGTAPAYARISPPYPW